LLKRTTSRCPVCHAACPAEVWRVAGAGGGPAQVFLERSCSRHGKASMCIASDARFYWLAKGNPENAKGGCCSVKSQISNFKSQIPNQESQIPNLESEISNLKSQIPAGVACCASDG